MVIIRADGNAKIGAGHLMRCLTIAEALADKLKGREDICFFCADEQSADMVRAAGFGVKVLESDYRDMESELPKWESLVAESMSVDDSCVDFAQSAYTVDDRIRILVDSYHVTDAYLEQLRHYGKVYLMDDMQEHAYPVDGVINYNAFADAEVYRELYGDKDTKCLVGSAYVPIRQQFLSVDYEPASCVENVLITTGGGDVDNIAGKILQTIYREGISFHIVTGRFNPHLETLREAERSLQGVHIYHDVSDMAGLMQKCDMAVTAGGTTIYELAAVGVPFLCFSYAKNQEALTEYVGAKQIAGYLGAYHRDSEGTLNRLKELFDGYCSDYVLRWESFKREREMIDGKGAWRLAGKLI